MEDIVNIMNKNFSWVIEVPRLENIYEKNRIFEFYPEHVAYYDLVTLGNLLWKYFFIDSIEKAFDWQYLLAKVSNKKMYLDSDMKDIEELSQIISKYNYWEIVMWWAWAKWINILWLLGKDICNKIILIDWDINKTWKYTPSSHIKIQDKNFLKNNLKAKAIIISADMYKKEIIKDLIEVYNYKNDIILISDKPEIKNILEYYK